MENPDGNTISLGDPREDNLYPEDEQFMLGNAAGVPDPMKEAMPVSPHTADKMAFKFFYGLGDVLKKSQDEIYSDILEGKEIDLRTAAATEIDSRKSVATQKALTEFARRKGGKLGFDDIDFIEGTIKNMTQATDIYSVLEEGFGRETINELERTANTMPGTFWQNAQKEVPVELEDARQKGNRLRAQTEFINTLADGINDEISQQNTFGWTWDQIKFFFPGYSDVQLRGNAPGVSAFDGLLGSNMMEQARALTRITDFQEYKDAVNKIVTPMRKSNPTLAAMFVQALQGLSTGDELVNNVLPLIDYTGLPYAAAGKGIKASARAAGLINEGRNAVRTQLREVANAGEVTPRVLASSAGNLEGAAIKDVSAKLIAERKGTLIDPSLDAIEALPDVLQTMSKKLEASPGRFGQELVNRINERRTGLWDEVSEAFLHMQRVERLPEVNASEAAAKAMIETFKDDHPGLRNRILNISVVEEPYSNTRFLKVNLGDNGAKYYASREVAENFAKQQGLLRANIGEQAGVPVGSPKRAMTDSELKKQAAKQKSLDDLEQKTIPNLQKRIDEIKAWKPDEAPVYVPKKATVETLEKHKKAFEGELEKYRFNASQGLLSEEERYTFQVGIKASEAQIKSLEKQIEAIKSGKAVEQGSKKAKEIGEIEVPKLQEQLDLAREIATRYREELGLNAPKDAVEQQGLGYYITRYFPVRETSSDLRNVMETETKREGSITKSPISMLNSFIGMLRSPEDTLSLAQRENRKTATYTPSVLIDIAKRNAAEIKDLVGWKNLANKQRWKDFTRIVEHAMDETDPVTKLKGYFYETTGQLDDAYQRLIGRLPDEKETRAYFAFVDQMELDRMMRNITEHRNRSRVGAETHQFYSIDGAGNRVGSGEFDGVLRGKFPGGEGAILHVGDTVGTEKVYALGHIPPKLLKEFQDDVASGKLKLIEVYNPEYRYFRNFGPNVGDRRIRYVMSRDVETKPLTWDHVPRRGGGHFEYESDFYIKQPIMREEVVDIGNVKTAWYEGDRTIMAVPIRAMGNDVAKILNQVKDLIREGKLAEAEALSNSKMQVSWDEVHGWFKEKRGPNGEKLPPALSLDPRDRIQVVPKNSQTINMSKEIEEAYGLNALKDGTRSGSLGRQYQVQYAAERDAIDLTQASLTKDSPLFKITPADKLDPITTMNRALQRIVNSNFMDDYKIFSVEHWLADANHWLKANKSDVRHSPFWHFNNPDWKPDAPPEIVRALETQRYQIQTLMGIPSTTDSLLHSAAQKLADSVYTNLGPKFMPLDPSWILPKLSDPFRWMRSVVFNTSIGLFNLPQFLVQSMNYVNILGLAGPKYATSGTYAAQLHFWSTVNSHPNILNHLDKMASKLHFPGMSAWRPGEFKEAYEHLKLTGFGNVGREYAVLDDIQKNAVIQSKGQDFLDMGTIFFRGGERNARYGSWYTAFKEWRDANPTATIGKAERAQILERADLLNINMSRASSSMLHTGILSIPTQFYTYQIRVIELMLGNRISKMDKLRLFGTNAMMYGLPAAGGVFGFPAADALRTYALENGYVVGDQFLSSLMMEGVPASILALSGYNYNFGDRYGTKGLETINNMFRSDKTMWDVFGGAAYSKLKSTWQSSDGFRMAMSSMFRTDSKWEPTADDAADVFKEVSSFNSAFRLAAALNTGKWLSKKEAYITDVTPMNAIFQTITGMTEQKVSDIYRMTQSLAAQKDLEKYVEKQFDQEFKRFLIANKDNNREQAQKYLTRSIAFLRVGGYPQDKISSLIARSADINTNMIERIDWSFYIENAPDSQQAVRLDAFKRKARMSEKL